MRAKRTVSLICLAVASFRGQTPLSMPAWMVAYPGATVRTQNTPGLLESTYETAAGPDEVSGHFRKLFEAAGLSFQPSFDGMGIVVRGTAPEGDLLVLIRKQGKGTWVRVDLAARSQTFAAVPAPAAPATRLPGSRLPALRGPASRPRENGRESVQNMEKYDQPVRPPRRPPPPKLVWPAWLVHIDGAPLRIEKGVDLVKLDILKCSYATYSDRNAIQTFYADLLNTHEFPVRSQSGPSWPRKNKAWIEASDHELGEGPGIDIRVEIAPLGEALQVDLRMTAGR